MVHSDTFRGFIGLVPPAEALEGLGLLRDRLLGRSGQPPGRCAPERATGGAGRWRPVPEGSFHLTLKFLGPIRWDQVPDLEVLLRRVAASTPPVVTVVGGRIALPDERRARALALRVSDPTDTLKAMAHVFNVEAAAFGFPLEVHPFLAHVTVGRRAGGRRKTSRPQAAPGSSAPPNVAPASPGAVMEPVGHPRGVTGSASTVQGNTRSGSGLCGASSPPEPLVELTCAWNRLALFRSNGNTQASARGGGLPAEVGAGNAAFGEVGPGNHEGIGSERLGTHGDRRGGTSAGSISEVQVPQREGRYTQIVTVPLGA